MNKSNLIITFLASVFMISAISCKGTKNANTNGNEEEMEVLPDDIVELREDQKNLAGIKTGPVETRSMSNMLSVNGTVILPPKNHATVCMPMGGFVKSVLLMPGVSVNKGQTLAILENQEFVDIQESYLEASSKLVYAEAEYQRHNQLYKNDVYSQKNVQQVTAEYKSLKAHVKAFDQKLSMIGIDPAGLTEDKISSTIALVSPISGYVKTVNVNPGKYVGSNDILFEIVNSDELYLELTLYEKDAGKVSSGQKIHFFINNEAERHDGVIYQTGKSINNDKTFNVYARVLENCKNVLPGMYVKANIEITGDEVTAVPSEAIVNFEDKDYIFIFEKDKEEDGKPFTEYRMVQVQKGITQDGYTQITYPDGVDLSSDKIVIKGAYNLLSAKKNAGEMAC